MLRALLLCLLPLFVPAALADAPKGYPFLPFDEVMAQARDAERFAAEQLISGAAEALEPAVVALGHDRHAMMSPATTRLSDEPGTTLHSPVIHRDDPVHTSGVVRCPG